jgi:hypothetical protein
MSDGKAERPRSYPVNVIRLEDDAPKISYDEICGDGELACIVELVTGLPVEICDVISMLEYPETAPIMTAIEIDHTIAHDAVNEHTANVMTRFVVRKKLTDQASDAMERGYSLLRCSNSGDAKMTVTVCLGATRETILSLFNPSLRSFLRKNWKTRVMTRFDISGEAGIDSKWFSVPLWVIRPDFYGSFAVVDACSLKSSEQ